MPPDRKAERRPPAARPPGNEPTEGYETEQVTTTRERAADDPLLH